MRDPSTRSAIRYQVPEQWNSITERVIACAIEVHRHIGPGLLESLYEEALLIELNSAGLVVERQKPVRMDYKGRPIGSLRLDMVVEGLIVVELKVVEHVLDVHLAQLTSYLRSADLPIGLLINFSHGRLVDGLSRRINDRCSLMRSLPLISQSSSESAEHSELSACNESTTAPGAPA